MSASDDPFRVLGIPATADAGAVRRAYFAAVQRHPPHADPVAFRRIRSAYESLSNTAGRSAAVVLAPVDVAAELEPLRARFDAPLADAAGQARAASEARHAARRFAEHVSGMTWAEALRAGAER